MVRLEGLCIRATREGQVTMEKQREKLRGGITGKGFVKGDPRINRANPGPGRPPVWWKNLLATYEGEAIEVIAHLMRKARHESIQLRAAQEILDRLHGKPTQPVQQLPPIDVSNLSEEELETLDRLLARVSTCNGTGGQATTR